MSGKKFVRLTLALTAAFLVFVAAVNIVVDPLFQYHKPWFGLEPVITNERYQNAGVIKHFDFDNAILGTSLSENFTISEVNDTFGGNSVKLTMYGSSIYNMTYQLELMKKREEKPKVIMCDMSPILFEAPNDKLKNPLPTFLYNNNLFDDGEYFWNFSILNDFCVSRSENRSCTGFEPHSRRSFNRTSAAHLTAHGLPDIISTAHIV